MDKENDSRGNDVEKNNYNRWLGNNERNQKEQHQGMGSGPSIGEEQWVIMERRQNCIHGRKNICSKQQETQRKDSTRES